MSYRAHVVVFDGNQRLSLAALKALRAPDANGELRPLGNVGTRYGAPGIWVEVSPSRFDGQRLWGGQAVTSGKDVFVLAIRRLTGKLTDRGLTVRVYTTNAPSQAALQPLLWEAYRNPAVTMIARG